MKFEQPNQEEEKIEKKLKKKIKKAEVAAKVGLTAALLSMGLPAAADTGGEIGGKDSEEKPKTEVVADKQTPPLPENTYDATGDFESFVALDVGQYFDVDKVDIGEENKEEIRGQVIKFLDNANPKDLLENDIVIHGSSDEIPTNRWKGGNEELANARIDATGDILEDVIDNYNFEGKGLTPEEIQKIRDKGFISDVAQGGEEKGVTYITDMINPETGKYYTSEEVEDIKNTDKYKELLSKARKVLISLESESHGGKLFKGTDNAYKNLTNEMAGYSVSRIFADASSSMANNASIETLSKFIDDAKEKLEDTRIIVGTFLDKMHNDAKISENVAEDIDRLTKDVIRGSEKQIVNEKVITSANQYLDKFNAKVDNPERSVMYLLTDEAIQDANYNSIQKLKANAERANMDIFFYVFTTGEGDNKVAVISLNELERDFMDIHDKFLEKQKEIHGENFNLERAQNINVRMYEQALNDASSKSPSIASVGN